jgi:hypothetical protein
MLTRTKDIIGLKLGAQDGVIGRIKDLYFDDVHWVVRHLVADTGNWLPKRQVLISPFAIRDIPEMDKVVDVNLTKAQIEGSPSVMEDQPVSRQLEAEYYRYYGWPMYWQGPFAWGPFPYPSAYIAGAAGAPDKLRHQDEHKKGDPHLRSVKEVTSYRIRALDDEFGYVKDFILDVRQSWAIRYLLIDIGDWWPGKKVLLPPQWLSDIDWKNFQVHIDLDRETVKRAPEYIPGVPITREYEEELFGFYNRQPYWESEPLAHLP